MKTKAMKKILSMLLVCVMLVGALAGFNVFAAGETTVEIVSTNVWYGEALYPMYAVETTGDIAGYEIEVKVTVNEKTYTCIEVKDDPTYGTCYVAPVGVAAQNINTVYEATPYLKNNDEVVATGDTQTYSVLEYLYERLYVDNIINNDKKVAEKNAYEALIAYATAADLYLNSKDGKTPNNIGSLCYVNVEGDDANTGICESGTKLNLTTTLEAEDGYVVVWTITDSNGNTTKLSVDEMAETGYIVTDKAVLIAAKTEESNEGKVETTLATFELGTNGAASHKDGSSAATYTETVNGYTLEITGGTNMYTGAYDATGNSCIKFGTNKGTGSMTFTVPDNVTQVKIYVAKYKEANTKITVNGTAYTLKQNSTAGQYDVITVDTSSSKTVSFTTVSSSQRAMLNTIEFIGYAN